MRSSVDLRFVAVASVALSLTACSSLTQPNTYEVDKDSVTAARPKPQADEPAPAPDGSIPGAVAIPAKARGGAPVPLRVPGRPGPKKQGG